MDFLNDLGKLFSHAAKNMTGRTRDEAADENVVSELRAAQDELNRQFAELGKAYFESLEDSSIEISAELIDSVRATLGHIQQLLTHQARTRQIRCANCGAVQSEDANFCSKCGKRMTETLPTPADLEGDYCARCGAMRHGSVKYCEVCGHAFYENDTLPVSAKDIPKAALEPLEEPEHSNWND